MVRYQLTCSKCTYRRSYEGKTLGDCFDQAAAEGWEATGELTKRHCKTCAGGERRAEIPQ